MELTTGEADPLLLEDQGPAEAGARAWDWFWDLSAGRGGTGFGPAPLSYQEIGAWLEITRARPEPWEIRAIRAMDAEYLAFAVEQAKRKS